VMRYDAMYTIINYTSISLMVRHQWNHGHWS